jgi:GDP-mannose pyrophosphatase NudK
MSSTSAASEPTSAQAARNIPEVEILDHFKEGSAWSTFHRIRYRVRGAGGDWIPQEREFLDRGDAIALLPYCPETGHVLLTRQFRMPVYLRHPAESMLLECCGGILDDPNPEVTLRHEAVEELGIELTGFEKVFEGYSTPGSVCEKVHYFIAPYTPEQRLHAGGGIAHEGEDIEIVEMPLTDALRLVRTHEIRDVRTIALLLYLAANKTIPALDNGPSASPL